MVSTTELCYYARVRNRTNRSSGTCRAEVERLLADDASTSKKRKAGDDSSEKKKHKKDRKKHKHHKHKHRCLLPIDALAV